MQTKFIRQTQANFILIKKILINNFSKYSILIEQKHTIFF